MPIRNRYHHQNVEGIRVGKVDMGINTTFIVYRIDDILIDCGPPNQWQFVQEYLSDKSIRQVFITHHHEDHSGNAANIGKMFNLLPYAPALSQKKIAEGYYVPPVQRLVWGGPIPADTQTMPEELSLSDGSRVIPVHTPGHAKDLTCLFLPEKGWFFSGDLYISRSIKYFRSDENLQQLIESIRKVVALDFEVIFCPHRGIVENGKAAMTDKLNHLEALVEQAQDLQKQGVSSKKIVKRLLGKEGMLSYLSGFNISKINLIEQALKVML
ncbi:MBL fold metallo-hydrolase [Aliikangiella sp. G2MR2-5]|uniref:MBL fold metallo-hydrolase n=1 Tax=Aliikangiella sp. G2MR2-5 TaxID=2788943 RepID=UPI0018A926F8|nr:MBL fold metallo-hydrolase [Aliikangiella sp. G2MR2-5]